MGTHGRPVMGSHRPGPMGPSIVLAPPPRSSPPLLLLHGLSSGYGDQVALVWTFLASGVLCPRVAGRQLCGLERLWLSPQIAGSMSVVTLIAIHVVVVTRDH